jgi:hypothetical protein
MTNRAHARATDPWTSHSAADSIADVTPLQYRLLQCFDVEMAMTDEELVKVYARTWGITWPATDSSIRSRRSELVGMGQLLPTNETRKTKAGHKSIVWTRNMVLL